MTTPAAVLTGRVQPPPSRLIHARVWNPKGPNLFRVSKNDKATLHTIECGRAPDCEAFARGECILRLIFASCPYGRATTEEGYSQRAQRFGAWIREARERTAGVASLACPPRKIARVGDFMWLPYAHMEQCKELPWRGGFLPATHFTAEACVALAEFRPKTMWGDEIPSYQKDVVPLFLSHLTEQYPEMLARAGELSARVRAGVAGITRVGRKARLSTLLPNVGLLNGGWKWDGTHLTTTTEAVAHGASLFLPVRAVEVRVVPVADAEVKTTSDEQVGPNTVFVD